MHLDRGIILRLLFAFVLAGGALYVFLAPRHNATLPGEKPVASQPQHDDPALKDWRLALPALDRDIDTLLDGFGIEKKWMKKKQYTVPEENFSRTERKIDIPTDYLPVELNAALNELAHRYHGRAVASENLKEHVLTIHLELSGYIVQTLILNPKASLHRAGTFIGPQKA